MSFLRSITLTLILFLVSAVSEFSDQRQKMACINFCEAAVSQCLKVHGSPCEKDYVTCHQEANFIGCLQKSKVMLMREVVKCMKRDCEIGPEQEHIPKTSTQGQLGSEFRKFKEIKLDDEVQVATGASVQPKEGQDIQQNQPVSSQGIRKD